MSNGLDEASNGWDRASNCWNGASNRNRVSDEAERAMLDGMLE